MAPASAVPHPRNAFLFVGSMPAREGTYGLRITRMVIHSRYVHCSAVVVVTPCSAEYTTINLTSINTRVYAQAGGDNAESDVHGRRIKCCGL